MSHHGWYQVAFEGDVNGAVSSVAVGPTPMVLLRTPAGVRIADAVCPHRGAHLAFGGRLDGGALRCPFHGFRIGLGEPSEQGFCVREYRTLVAGGLVFVQLSDEHDNGFARAMEQVVRSHVVVPGFTVKVRTSAEMVIENAFDQAHFGPVHGIGIPGAFRMRPSEAGELAVEGTFELPPSPWQRGRPGSDGCAVPFFARAFSPGLVVADVGGAHPYTIITAATPTADGDCVIRLSLVVPRAKDGGQPPPELCDYVLRRSRAGIEKDRVVWEHLSVTAAIRDTPLDDPVRKFRDFCARFAKGVLV